VDKKGRSLTAEAVAIQQALHQTLDAAPKILDDPISPLLFDLTSETQFRQSSIACDLAEASLGFEHAMVAAESFVGRIIRTLRVAAPHDEHCPAAQMMRAIV